MTNRDTDQLAVDRHPLHEARRDVVKSLDRLFLQIPVERLKHCGDLARRPVVDHIADD